MKVVDHALAEYVPQIRARSLPESCLLRLVHDPSVPGGGAGSAATEEDSRRPPEPEYMLRPCGQGWQLRFAGHETQWLLPAIGLAYLREVLRFPEKSFTVSELLIAVHGQKAALPLGDAGGDLDDQAKRAYAHHLGELEQELDEARDDGDLARQERLARERQQFLEHFKVTGLLSGGKRASTDLDRLRNSVGNAIRRALDTIAKYEPAGFAHLKSSLSLGYTVTYRPAEPIRWDL